MHPTQRSLAILAAIARGEGAEDAVVRDLVAQALAAPRGPQWCCDKCQAIRAAWGPICDNCGSFDTLSWREPPPTVTPLPGLVDLLPLMEARPTPTSLPPPPEPEPDLPDDIAPDDIARRAN